MRMTTLDFAHNLPALGRVVARRQAQMRASDVWVTTTDEGCGDAWLGHVHNETFTHTVPPELSFGNLDAFALDVLRYPHDYDPWKAAEELALASGYKLIVDSPPEGDVARLEPSGLVSSPVPLPVNVEYDEQAVVDSTRGSFFARRPDEKARPRRRFPVRGLEENG